MSENANVTKKYHKPKNISSYYFDFITHTHVMMIFLFLANYFLRSINYKINKQSGDIVDRRASYLIKLEFHAKFCISNYFWDVPFSY